jgi:hypothetical protein
MCYITGVLLRHEAADLPAPPRDQLPNMSPKKLTAWLTLQLKHCDVCVSPCLILPVLRRAIMPMTRLHRNETNCMM